METKLLKWGGVLPLCNCLKSYAVARCLVGIVVEGTTPNAPLLQVFTLNCLHQAACLLLFLTRMLCMEMIRNVPCTTGGGARQVALQREIMQWKLQHTGTSYSAFLQRCGSLYLHCTMYVCMTVIWPLPWLFLLLYGHSSV